MSQRLVQFKTKGSGMQVPVYPALPPWLALTQGNIYCVKPRTGNDFGNDGSTPDKALKTIKRAHELMTANQNDICLLFAEHASTSSSTTDYQSLMLTWSKNMCHLIGVNNGVSVNPRSRIAQVAGWTSANPLMTWSANGCYVAGVSLWSGVTDVNTLGCLKVTGQRNRFERMHIAGMGTAATNDIAGAYSLLLSGAAENEFRECTIGVDIQSLGANANSQILTAANCFDNRFFDCEIRIKAGHNTNSLYLRVPTTTMLGQLKFTRCQFTNNGANTLTYGSVIHASAGVKVYFTDCHMDATDVASADEANIFVGIGGVNNTSGLYVVVETT